MAGRILFFAHIFNSSSNSNSNTSHFGFMNLMTFCKTDRRTDSSGTRARCRASQSRRRPSLSPASSSPVCLFIIFVVLAGLQSKRNKGRGSCLRKCHFATGSSGKKGPKVKKENWPHYMLGSSGSNLQARASQPKQSISIIVLSPTLFA